MRLTTILHASPLLLALVLGLATGCGSKVISGGGGGNGSGNGFAACDGPGQCMLVSTTCCGGCGQQELAGTTAINAAQSTAYFASLCPEDIACPACAEQPNPNLFAYCDNGTCRAADTRTHEVGACTQNEDCMLRAGTGCCEPCGPGGSELTSVSTTSNFSSLVCAPDQPCDACLPAYPTDASAYCNAGHCEVVFVDLGGG